MQEHCHCASVLSGECPERMQILRAQVSRYSSDIEMERRKKTESERIHDARVGVFVGSSWYCVSVPERGIPMHATYFLGWNVFAGA